MGKVCVKQNQPNRNPLEDRAFDSRTCPAHYPDRRRPSRDTAITAPHLDVIQDGPFLNRMGKLLYCSTYFEEQHRAIEYLTKALALDAADALAL